MATGEKEAAVNVPAYVPYKTLLNFVDGLKISIPSRIDRSVVRSLSGAMQSQLLTSLRYLRLIDDKGVPTDMLARLVASEGKDREKALADMLRTSYSFLFQNFDLQRATGRQVEEKFVAAGVSGDTVRKCMAFFLSAAKHAGITVSPHIKMPSRARTAGQRIRGTRVEGAENGSAGTPPQTNAGQVSWTQMLLSKFPSFDPAWPDDVKVKWFEAFDKLMNKTQEPDEPE